MPYVKCVFITAAAVIGLSTGLLAQDQIFQDVPPSAAYFSAVNQMYLRGITTGCTTTPLSFCPMLSVTRGEVAVFLIRAIYSAATSDGENFTYTSSPYFTDVPPSHPFFKYIQKMKDLGITNGTTPPTYAPDSPVDHGQLAVFTVRAARFLHGSR
jgi:hypothetical protein